MRPQRSKEPRRAPPDAPRRHHRGSHRRMDGAAGPQSRPQPRRVVLGQQVLDSRPRIEPHPLLRRCFPAHQRQDSARRPPGTAVNATCERLGGTLRREVLDRVLILGEAQPRAILANTKKHYNTAGRTRPSPSASPGRTRRSQRHRDQPRHPGGSAGDPSSAARSTNMRTPRNARTNRRSPAESYSSGTG